MNIVKVKDIKVSELPEGIDATIFAKFKGMYCYCINWKWLVLFEDYAMIDYVYCSQNNSYDNTKTHASYIDYINADLIDIKETTSINTIDTFIEFNKFTPKEEDLTLDEIKAFRTWLATTLYNLLKETETFKTVAMLNYYKNEMSDDTIKSLNAFLTTTANIIPSTAATKTCSCQQSLSLSSTISICDAVSMYRKGVYDKMVSVFSELDFWMKRESQLLGEFKRYIDYIIKFNLPLIASPYVSDFYDCGCLNSRTSAQEALMQILKDLSKSLQYMINSKDTEYSGDEKIDGHKNFIADTLLAWSSKLYEVMRW